MNEEFQTASLRLADDLNIDELDAARLFFQSQDEADASGQPPNTIAVISFHQRRKLILDSLRTIVQLAADVDLDETIREALREVVFRIIEPKGRSTTYVQKCLSSMADVKVWLHSLADKLNSAPVLGKAHQPGFVEAIQFQQASLVTQHESLGLIVFWLVKLNNSVATDFDLVLDTLRSVDRYDSLLCKCQPLLDSCVCCINQ